MLRLLRCSPSGLIHTRLFSTASPSLPPNVTLADAAVLAQPPSSLFRYRPGRSFKPQDLTVPVIANPHDPSPPASISLNPLVFLTDVRPDVMARVVRWQRAKAQQGTHQAKTRGEVSGGGRKPWRQKGTGRARQGSIRAPHWTGGGAVFGPTPRSHAHELNKKERALGLKSALAARWQEGNLHVLSSLHLPTPKTRGVFELAVPWQGALVVGTGQEEQLRLALRSVHSVDFLPQIGCNVYDVLRHARVIVSVESLRQLEARLMVGGLRKDRRGRVLLLAEQPEQAS